MFHRNKNAAPVIIPENEDWSERAVPSEIATRKMHPSHLTDWQKEIGRAKRENIAWMERKKLEQGGVLIGYHGTTAEAAEMIRKYGFKNRTNEEGLTGVSAWDEVTATRAIDFALTRSFEQPEDGVVFKIRMTNPEPDTVKGRLEWLADANNVEILEEYPTAELAEQLRYKPYDLGRIALSDFDAIGKAGVQ